MESEAEMVSLIKTFFEKKGFKVTTEVPMLSKRIDIVCLKAETQDVIAIEAKLKNWKRGIRQASTYRIGSDFTYLAIHRSVSHRVDERLLEETNIGLIVVDKNKIEILFEASKHMITHQKIREDIISYCRGEYLADI
jgi:hypothetical protein